ARRTQRPNARIEAGPTTSPALPAYRTRVLRPLRLFNTPLSYQLVMKREKLHAFHRRVLAPFLGTREDRAAKPSEFRHEVFVGAVVVREPAEQRRVCRKQPRSGRRRRFGWRPGLGGR